jgi:hypothetical protein
MKSQIRWTMFRKCVALCAASAVLASCASLIGPRQVDVPLSRLQQGLDRRFPLNNRVLELLDIELSHPQLSLLPDSDRIALSIDASIAPPFARQSWSGHLALSGRVTLDAARGVVSMSDARIDTLVVDGADAARQRQFAKVSNVIIDRLIGDMPLYTFRPEDLRVAGVQFVPTRITTTPSALRVMLEPAH